LAESLDTQHLEQHQSRMATDAVFISTHQLERRTRLLLLPFVALIVVLGLRTHQKSFSTICTGHWLPPYALCCFVVGGMQKGKQRTYFGCSFPYASKSHFYNSILSSFNPSHPHILPSHHTHLTTLSHSLDDKDDSRSCPTSTAKAENQHRTRGR
jgi:hypothetical protein